MAVDVNETETKYDAPAGAALPRLDGLPQVAGTSRPAEEQLEAEYYDTGDLRLIRAGITLQRRNGGEDAGWGLKLPGGAGTRPAARNPRGGPRRPPGGGGQQVPGELRGWQQVPGELAGLIRAYTRGEPL